MSSPRSSPTKRSRDDRVPPDSVYPDTSARRGGGVVVAAPRSPPESHENLPDRRTVASPESRYQRARVDTSLDSGFPEHHERSRYAFWGSYSGGAPRGSDPEAGLDTTAFTQFDRTSRLREAGGNYYQSYDQITRARGHRFFTDSLPPAVPPRGDLSPASMQLHDERRMRRTV
eukprot:scaffold342213_cov38-Prasinocladus_malaysianus.AAC.1